MSRRDARGRARRWLGAGALVLTVSVLHVDPAPAEDGAGLDAAATATAGAVRIRLPARTITVAAVGDFLPESRVLISAARHADGSSARYDFEPMFAPVAPIIGAADLAICHIETPIGAPGEPPGVYGRSPYGGNLLLAPDEVAAGMRATGFDRCSTASNHSNDLGASGVASTLAALDDVGLTHTGTARNADEARPGVFDVGGIRVAHLSYSRYSNTVWPTAWWSVADGRDLSVVARDVADVRDRGAEIVIVSLHISQELQRQPLADDRRDVEALTAAADIDLVVEHGPHVVQPVEVVNGTAVFWSVGNFVSGMGPPTSGRYADPRTADGLLAFARFTEVGPGVFETSVVPVTVCNERSSRTVYAPSLSLDDERLTAEVRGQLAACLDRTRQVVPTAV